MNTPFVQQNLVLLGMIFLSSASGITYYVLLRFLEIRAPLVIILLGLPSAFVLMRFGFNLSPDGLIRNSYQASIVSVFSLAWLVICCCAGARIHRSIQTTYGGFFNAILVAVSITFSVLTVAGLWNLSPYGHSTSNIWENGQIFIPTFYICVFFCSIAPVATAHLLEILRDNRAHPGLNKPFMR